MSIYWKCVSKKDGKILYADCISADDLIISDVRKQHAYENATGKALKYVEITVKEFDYLRKIGK